MKYYSGTKSRFKKGGDTIESSGLWGGERKKCKGESNPLSTERPQSRSPTVDLGFLFCVRHIMVPTFKVPCKK